MTHCKQFAAHATPEAFNALFDCLDDIDEDELSGYAFNGDWVILAETEEIAKEVVDAAEFTDTRQRHPEIDRHLAIADLVVVNKVDRAGARPDWVVNQTFDLFDKLGATEEQLDFLTGMLEEEDSEDRDYWIDEMTLQYFQENGADPALLKLLQDAIGDADGIEIEWVSDEEEGEQ